MPPLAQVRSEDGLTRNFFLEFWDVFRAPLLIGFQHFFDFGHIPESCSGLISLGVTLQIFGSGDRSLCLLQPIRF